MKNLLTTTLLFSVTFLFAQITKNVGDFTKVTAFDKIEVILIQADENKVDIYGNEAADVQFVNKNGELKIRMPIDKILAGENISVKVFYKKITAIEANEGSRIATENAIKSIAFDVIAKEGATILLNIETKKLTSKISSGAAVDFEGTASAHDSVINSGGILNAKKLITTQSNITCNAGGNAQIFATQYVNAKVRAGGNIVISGKPKQIDQKTILGGSITQN